jgi:8-oxo-dGTP pyrophosphatase MutT (NUDIX family)
VETAELERLRSVLLSVPDGGRDGECAVREYLRENLIPASVMFPIVLRDDAPQVLLTRRTCHLRDHPGQICFPGGRADPEDASPAHTALREVWEETGISSDRIEVIGYLPDRRTVTGFRITPVVAFIRPPFELNPDAFEVADIFEAPLAFLLDAANHHVIPRPGKENPLFSIAFGSRRIWGATAGIIRALSERLAAAPSPPDTLPHVDEGREN